MFVPKSCGLFIAILFVILCENILHAEGTVQILRAIDIFQKMIEARELVKSARYIVTLNTNIPSSPLGNGEAVFDIAFENDRSRIAKKMGEREVVFCINCQPNVFAALTLHPLFYANKQPDSSSNYTGNQWGLKYPFAVLSLRELDLKIPDGAVNRFSTYDYALPSLRDVGMTLDFASARTRDATVALKLKSLQKSNDVSVSEDDIDGDLLTKISWKSKVNTGIMIDMPDGTRVEAIVDNTYHFWIDLRKNYIVRKIVYKNNSNCIRTLTNTVKKHVPSGIWCVESWIIDEERANKFHAREEGSIQFIAINNSFPENFFTLADISQLETGMQVDWDLNTPPPNEGRLFWSGKDVVGMGDLRLPLPSQFGTKRRILIVICINVAVISFIIARILYTQRRKNWKTK